MSVYNVDYVHCTMLISEAVTSAVIQITGTGSARTRRDVTHRSASGSIYSVCSATSR